jgi:hypothetical protein
MAAMTDASKSLQELEGLDWGEPDYPSHLVKTCHRLRRKPLQEFTVEDLRIMIGQKMSLDHLMPLALDRLRNDPLAEGDFFPGDLLKNFLMAAPAYVAAHPDATSTIDEIVRKATPLPKELDGVEWPPAR